MAKRYSVIVDAVGLEYGNMKYLPNIAKLAEQGESAKMETVFPAVTCTVQASILSGKYPHEHGIIANGLYDRNTYAVSFWEQPSSLVQARRPWDYDLKGQAVLFWQNTMYANADFIVTPRPIHLDEGMVMWCYSKPVGYYEEMTNKFGQFDLSSYWGPLASYRSSEWIIRAAEYTIENHKPSKLFVYIPHVDYSAQRFGKTSTPARDDLQKVDELVGRLVQKTVETGIRDQTQFVILSEYAFNDVNGAIPLNLVLRDAGLLSVRTIQDKEYIDFEFSKAFAMVDHQVAHVFVCKGFDKETRKVLEETAGVDKVLDDKGKKELHIDHPRSGELIAIANRDKWFSYYWWHDESKAPSFARRVDIHRKPGYDPVELFFDTKTKSISMDTSLVKGSHGRPTDQYADEGFGFYASTERHGIVNQGIAKCTDIVKCL